MPAHALTARCALAYGPNVDGLCEWDGRVVPARRVRFCSDACRAAAEEAHRWPQAKAAALRRAARRCVRCGAHGVEVHHVLPVGEAGYGPGCQHHADNLLVLCPEHHRDEHARLRAQPGAQLVLFGRPPVRRRRRARPPARRDPWAA